MTMLASGIDSQLQAALITAAATIVAALIPIAVVARKRRQNERGRVFQSEGSPLPLDYAPAHSWESVDYGRFRSWSDGLRPRTLVVFVHGVMSDPERAWRRLPDLLAERVGPRAKFDVLSFGYPAKLLHEGDIERAAKRLISAISETYTCYDDYIFITHSTGGLVVKLAMLEMLERIVKRISGAVGEESRAICIDDSRAFRVRRIVNIAVPHSGATRTLTLLLIFPYQLLWPIIWPLAFTLTALAFVFKWIELPKGYSYGFNKVAWQLRHGNWWLEDMETRFREVLRRCDEHCLPRPVSVDIHGTEDSAIAEADRAADSIRFEGEAPNRQTSHRDGPLVMLGTHPTVKSAQSTSDAIVVFVTKLVTSLDNGIIGAIARATVARSLELDGASRPIGSPVASAYAPEAVP